MMTSALAELPDITASKISRPRRLALIGPWIHASTANRLIPRTIRWAPNDLMLQCCAGTLAGLAIVNTFLFGEPVLATALICVVWLATYLLVLAAYGTGVASARVVWVARPANGGGGVAIWSYVTKDGPGGPEWHGRGLMRHGTTRGIGLALITHVCVNERPAGTRVVITAGNHKLAEVYERHGFRHVGPVSARRPMMEWID